MKNRIWLILLLAAAPVFMQAQNIIFSDAYREDGQDMNFDILGRIKGNIVIFKNVRWKYAVNVFDDSMQLKSKVELDFIPSKTFNVDCIPYPDFFYLIYQYQKKGILYCMAVKMDANGQKLNEPVQLDTTHIGSLGDNKIYATINSEDKKQIMVFKIQRKDDYANFTTLLFDNELQLKHKSRISIPYDERLHNFGDFYLDNKGNFVFVNTERKSSRDNPTALTLLTKQAELDSFHMRRVDFGNTYLDEVKMKVDNINNRYIVNSFYYTEKSGNIEGLYTMIWDAAADSLFAKTFTQFNDDLKSVAKSSGSYKSAFNDFYIRNIILKKDGSFILTAEDQTSQTSGMNNYNRFDYLYGSPYYSPMDYYLYSPSYYGTYRPFSSFNNLQNIRYYYDNILVLNIAKNGIPEWSNIIHKQQSNDENDNYLSFNTFNTSGELHFLYNDISRRDRLLSDNVMTPDGNSRRNPTLRTYERGYDFMPRFARQIGPRQVIIPATYRGYICFAKVDF